MDEAMEDISLGLHRNKGKNAMHTGIHQPRFNASI